MATPQKFSPTNGTPLHSEKQMCYPKTQPILHRYLIPPVHNTATSPAPIKGAMQRGREGYGAAARVPQPLIGDEPPPSQKVPSTNTAAQSTGRSVTPQVSNRRRGPAAKQLPIAFQGAEQGSPTTTHPPGQTTTPQVCRPFSQEDIAKIEKETRGQRENPEWYNWRKNRITASLAHQISHSKFVNQKSDKIPYSYLYSVVGKGRRVQTPAMNWGIRNEKRAVQEFERLATKLPELKGRQIKVESCGLFIHPDESWLAASPDGLVKDGHTGETLGALEVKCPYKYKDYTVRKACESRNFYLTLDSDSYTLRKNHTYYTQVQCQLAVTQLSLAYFVVYTNKETAIANVKFDPEFWEETKSKLKKFYMLCVLPYIKKEAMRAAEE
ncbi:uncharacterized protein O3C94_004548 [Discoglossus pictus]